MFRIYRTYAPDGSKREPWFFSSVAQPKPGRFDLPPPHGTCYLADRPAAAWLEVFRGTRLVARSDAETRSMLTAVRIATPLSMASLVSARAVVYGVNLDLSAGNDYLESQTWADLLHRAGFPGLIGWIRHDPTAKARNVALFGRAGGKVKVSGWRGRPSRLVEDLELRDGLAVFGIGVHDEPYDVPITPVSARVR
jgi:hypothetical protein